jgi:hypothetical protein
MMGVFSLDLYINKTLQGWKMMNAKSIALEGNKNNNSLFFAKDQAHLKNKDYLLQNVMKLDEMSQACDEKMSGKVEAMVLKTQV